MLQSMRILLLSSLAILPAATEFYFGTAFAASDTDTRKRADEEAKAQAEAKARQLAEAIAACDKGAAIPLDADARAAPVQFQELYPVDFDRTKLKPLQASCQAAWAGAPGQKRLQLQWLRVTVAMDEPGVDWTIPQLKLFADAGSAEAQFLMFNMYYYGRHKAEQASFTVSREDGIAYLKAAAEQGHLLAMMEMMSQYRYGPLLRRDPMMAVKMGRRIESAPPQGIEVTKFERDIKAYMPLSIALTTLEGNGFTPQETKAAFRVVEAEATGPSSGFSSTVLAYIRALREGKGTGKDPAKARKLLEARIASDDYAVPIYADMLARGEGGPADVRRALGMLRDKRVDLVGGARRVLAGLLLDGKTIGPQPQEAIVALYNTYDLDSYMRLSSLLLDYRSRLTSLDSLVKRLDEAVLAGEPGAALTLARLKLSDNSQLIDVAGARALLQPLVEAGDRQALWLYAGSQYLHLDSTSYQPQRQEDGLSDSDLKRLLEEGVAKKDADAYLLSAKFLRRGVLYPQDDQKATKMLVEAANLGNVEALVLLGNAYDDGLGTQKDARERTRAWRRAAAMGSLEAKKKLANAFTFDTFDRLLTLKEGITERFVLYNNGVDRKFEGIGIASDSLAEMEFSGLFMGRASEAGTDAVAGAVMDAFREAPAGLEEKTLVGIGKALPDEIRVAIEKKLKQQGFYKGEPQGFFGPEVRAALADWVYANDPMGSDTAQAVPVKAKQGAADSNDVVAMDVVDRVRERVFEEARTAKSDKQKIAALKKINVLARYGDLASRWVLVRNYHQGRVVRKATSPEEISRYGLDILVKRPEGMEKPEFEFIFNTTQIAQDGKSGAFGKAVLDAIRDDQQLQDPLTLGGVMKQFIFAPEACESVLRAASKAGIAGIGSEGCDEQTMAAVIAYAKANGPAGTEAKARIAAATEIRSLDAQAAK